MKNIELKVALDDFEDLTKALTKIQAQYQGALDQVDIYFNCKFGRLKLREMNKQSSEILYYQRPDKIKSKLSDYSRVKILNQSNEIKQILSKALGVKVIVEKKRKLWIYKNTRIHLDEVVNLGRFLELETIIKDDFKDAVTEHQRIIKLLNLSKYNKLSNSYSDLIVERERILNVSATSANI